MHYWSIKNRKPVIFDAPSDGIAGTQANFERVIIRDDSRLLLYHPCDSIWVASFDDGPNQINQKTNAESCLIPMFPSYEELLDALGEVVDCRV
jgi:hypothetical protein